VCMYVCVCMCMDYAGKLCVHAELFKGVCVREGERECVCVIIWSLSCLCSCACERESNRECGC